MGARGRRRSAFSKNILRGIRGSLGRFFAIMGIVALGCGFFAGLQMSGPNMRQAADDLYGGTNTYDIRLVSTLGFTGKDSKRVERIEGVQSTMRSISFDAMARLGDEQMAVRISSLDIDVAEREQEQSASVITSPNEFYINRVFLRSGRWPRGPSECVIGADKNIGNLGVGDTMEVLYGTTDVDDVLRERTFSIVGTVSAPVYPYTGSFGSTTLGSGMIGEYLYVDSAAFVDDLPSTEIYVRVDGAETYQSGSDEYQGHVDHTRDRLKDASAVLAQERLDDVRLEAQKELDDARDEYNTQKEKADRELADAQKELDDASAELERGQKELDDGQRSYDKGVKELEESRRQLDDAQSTLESSRVQLEESYTELSDGEAAWSKGKEELLAGLGLEDDESLSAARAAVEAKRDELESGRRQLADGIAQAEAGIEQARAGVSQCEAGIAQLEAQIAMLPDGPQKQEAIATKAALESQLQEARAGLSTVQATKTQLEQQLASLPSTDELDKALAGILELEQTRATLDSGADQLVEGVAKYEEGLAEYESGLRQYTEGQAKLDDAYKELQSGKKELEDGRAEYEDGKAEYQKAKAEAEEKLADARRQIDDAQKEIDDIEEPDVYVLDRSQNEGMATYDADTHRMDSIADVFPFMFFLVAALVALTTMTRMVDDDRIEIGTYKALGYSTMRIASKYLWYAGAASVVGAAIGIAVLSQVLPYIITSSYSIIYTIPLHPFPLPVRMDIALLSGGLGVAVTLGATYAAVVASLRETPATLMLPRAPAAGKRILLERIGPLWSRLSFSWKVTFRNLFRYKRRLTMTVIGISGCTALLLVGFGLHDAIWDIIDCQYGPIIHYDTTVGLNSDATKADVDAVVDYLESSGNADDLVRVQQNNMRAGAQTGELEPMRVQVVVPRSKDDIVRAVTFRNRVSGQPVAFGNDSVVITEKLSIKYGLDVGDEIVLYEQDDIGNAVGDGYPLVVTGIAENYVGNLVYVGKDAWKKVDDEEPLYGTLLTSVTEDVEARSRIADELHAFDNVSTVIFSEESINLYRNMLSVVDLVVVVLIVSAGLLAFIVLYNLTNINIAERVREIASLKVLGFTKREVYAYIFREIALLAVLGDALGMVLGTYLETFVVTTAEVDYVMFGRSIHPMSYVYGFVLTLVFTALILLVMRHKLDRVNMVESLKSIE